MAAAIINDNDFVQLFQRTHQRLYLAFEGLDNQILAAQCVGGGDVPPGSIQAVWADSYLRWMSGYLDASGNGASASAVKAYQSLPAKGFAAAQLMATYPPNSFLLRSIDMVSVTAAGALPVKRQACPSPLQPCGTTINTITSSTNSGGTTITTTTSSTESGGTTMTTITSSTDSKNNADPVETWTRTTRWPNQYFEQDCPARIDFEHDSWLEEQMEESNQVVQFVEINGRSYPRPIRKVPTSLRRKTVKLKLEWL